MPKRKKCYHKSMGIYWKKILGVFGLFLMLPVLVYAVSVVGKYVTRASIEPANIIINAATPSAQLVPNWNSFSQGGESATNMIKPAVSQIAGLRPKFIRIDHLYDFYNIVSRDASGNLNFNFAALDDVVSDILKTGAQPFFSLSYMPASIASGDIVSSPKNYNEWALTVQKTVEHYSGKTEMNLSNVYYEVWNEPDLFGNFKYYGDKNYLDLYRFAALGAESARNTNFFKLGGPSITAYYDSWMRAFLAFCRDNKLKVDFVSWHRYTLNPNVFVAETEKFGAVLQEFPEYQNIERMITEFGFTPEVNLAYDSLYSAYHTAAVFAKLRTKVYQVFTFELVDGQSPKNETYWGRWGVLTSEKSGLIAKPRYYLWNVLNGLRGNLLSATGENDFISVIPTENQGNYRILIVNFDPDNIRVENVPVKISGIFPGNYHYTLSYPLVSLSPALSLDVVSQSDFTTQVLMDHNSLAVVELTKK